MEDWVDELVRRGVLTPEQAATARAGEAPATPESRATLPPPALALFACNPCGKVYSLQPGSAPPACPECQGALKAVQLGVMAAPKQAVSSEVTFGRYRLRRELGRGGMGLVYEAWDPELGRSVALKMLVAAGQEMDRTAVERLAREAKAVARLRHPSIVAIHDVGTVDGRHYFTMDLVEGRTLLEMIPLRYDFPLARRVEVLAEIAEALGYAHSQGIVHRDVKPGNVVIDGTGRAMLMDFGLARDTSDAGGATLTLTGSLLGTPQYMSPEQAARSHRTVGPPSDVFSLGAVMYLVLTEELPFPGDSVQSLHAILHSTPPPLTRHRPDLPPDLETICLKCLEKDSTRRYPDGAALAADLRRHLKGESVQALRSDRTAGRQESEKEALKLLERARPALERARKYLYDRDADYAELARRVDLALVEIERALAICPDLALGHYLHGLAFDLRGNDVAAEAAWREALRLDPDFGPAHFQLARLLTESAYASLRVSRNDSAPEPEAAARAAESVAEFERALEKGSGFDEGVLKEAARAMVHITRREYEAAAEVSRKALGAYPGAEGRETLYWMLGLCTRGSEAEAAIAKALEIRPKFPVGLLVRGNLKADRRDWEGAEQDFVEAMKLKPDFLGALHNRSYIRGRVGDWKGSRDLLLKIVEAHPDFVLGWVNLGVACEKMDDLDRADACYDEALRRNPNMPAIWNNRGLVHLRRGNVERALWHYEQALRIRPNYPRGLMNRGRVLADLGFIEDAMQDYNRALELAPDEVEVNNNRGWLFLDLKQPESALRDFRKVVAAHPRFYQSWWGIGETLHTLGDFAGALTALDKAAELSPGHADVLYWRSRCRHALGDKAGAADDLRQALKSGPSGWSRRKKAEEELLALIG